MDKHSKDVNAASFSPDGRYIVSGGYDHRLLLWDGHDGGFLRALAEDMENKVFAVTFSPDGERVLASSQGTSAGFTAIYELASGERVTRFRGHNNIVLASAWHPAGSLVASAGGDDEDIYLWRPDSGEVVHHLRGDGRSGLAVAFSKRGGLQVAFGQTSEGKGLLGNHLQRTFDFVAFTLEDLPADQPNPPEFRRTVVQRDGAELQKGGSSTLLIGDSRKIDDPAGGALIRSFTYTKSGQIVVGCSRNKRLQLFSDSGEPLREFIGHEGEVWAVSPSPDDRYLASASGDQTVRLWNLQTGELLASLFVSRDSEWVVWTPSGHYHASPGGEKYIGWHINRGVGRVADYYPAYVFREKFHHPELVKRTVLEFNDICRLIPECPGSALEVGAGSGRILRPLFDKGWEIMGIEPSAEMVSMFEETDSQAILEQVTLEEFDSEKRFHCILLTSYVFMLFREPEVVFEKLESLLSEGGVVYLSTFIPWAEIVGEMIEGEWSVDDEVKLPSRQKARCWVNFEIDR
ncbi:MAG: methyltransferase domain-containing protein, partial [Verrucomicrobiota bacterium]